MGSEKNHVLFLCNFTTFCSYRNFCCILNRMNVWVKRKFILLYLTEGFSMTFIDGPHHFNQDGIQAHFAE